MEYFRIAGTTLRVEWEDATLRDALRPALALRAAGPADVDLSIAVSRRVDSVGGPMRDGLVLKDDSDGLVVGDPAAGGIWQRVNRAGTRAEFGCAEPARLPGHECAAPFRLILQRALGLRGKHLLHAAAVGLPDGRAVLLAAPSGGGKSNTFLACATASNALRLIGEDFIVVDEAAVPRAWSFSGFAKLHPTDTDRFPELAGARWKKGGDERDGKALFDLGTLARARFADGLPIGAILVLAVTGGGDTRILPAAPGEAARAMLTSLLMVVPSARRPLFEFTTGLVRRIPAYRLELGRDPRQIAAAIEQFAPP